MAFHIEFENPDRKPIGSLILSAKDNGVKLNIPALSNKWIEYRIHTKYIPLPVGQGKLNKTTIEEWLTEADWFNKEIEWMLRLEHFRFWSYMVYDPGCISAIISFLQQATPSYIPITIITDNLQVLELYSKILRNILAVICRMVTNRESEIEWIAREHLAELLYTKFLISIPMIFDLIIAYGRANEIILRRLIQTIFRIEPKYLNDLKYGLEFIDKAFRTISEKIEKNDNNLDFNDLALYTLDCATTISILLNVYPDACELCADITMEQKITNFYDSIIPILYKNLYIIDSEAAGLDYLNCARMELIQSFRTIANMHLDKILKSPSTSLMPSESFLAMLQEALADRTFVIDYQRLYPVQNDVEMLKDICSDLDMFKVQFIIQAYTNQEEDETKLTLHSRGKYADENCTDGDGAMSLPLTTNESAINSNTSNLSKSNLTDNNIDINIQTVLDILPHLEQSFVHKLLQRYDNPESAIAAVLEGNLPPDIQENEDEGENVVNLTSIPYNDPDEQQFNHNYQKIGIIKQGKGFPGQPKTMRALLNDKSHVHEMKSRYQEYSIINEYEDEYDDSYEALAESETKVTKNVNTKKFLLNEIQDEINDDDDNNNDDNVSEHNSSDNEDFNGTESNQNRSNDFCENPEITRERMAMARKHKYGARTVGKSSANVVGKPKGQGQDASTQHSRQRKEVNKSTKSNHNRRMGAMFKRNRGMIPS